MSEKIIKKTYNSIPHLSLSRLGPGDHFITKNSEKILTKQIRDYNDLIIVTEKLDGSNMAILRKNNIIIPITRSGYHANTSRYKHHHLFSKWVKKYEKYFTYLLDENERVCGEWLLKTHGTKYNIQYENLLFRPFDIIKNDERLTYLDFLKRIYISNGILPMYALKSPKLLHIGSSITIKNIEKKLQKIEKDRIDKCEGAVYRCERRNEFNIIAKYVRPDKVDGIYMKEEVYNYDYTLI
jgi:ATP-dependent RNA circularization protein (DNA/RNA ligase family)